MFSAYARARIYISTACLRATNCDARPLPSNFQMVPILTDLALCYLLGRESSGGGIWPEVILELNPIDLYWLEFVVEGPHDSALARVMTAMMKDDTELFKQFMDNEGFKRWLTDTVFMLTYRQATEEA